MKRVMRYSNPMHETMAMAVVTRACQPKNHIEQRSAGTKAMMTLYMFLWMESLPWMCGDIDTINFLSMVISLFWHG